MMIEVTHENFEDVYPTIEYAIKTAEFIAIDTEFSGLQFDRSDKSSLFDSCSERYSKLRRSVQKFTLLQIGITTFCGNVETNRYHTQTFHFYLFPRSFASHDQRLCLQASAIQFLSKHKFDFNKWLHSGISFMNSVEEKEVTDLLQNGVLNSCIDRNMDDRELQSLCSYVTAWIPNSKPGDHLTLPVAKEFSDALYVFHKDLRTRFPHIWTSTNAFNQLVVKRVSPEERQNMEKEDNKSDDSYQNQLLSEMLGFTRVFRLLQSARKPLVGHNMLTDLLFLFEKFHAPLPEKYESFKTCLHGLFPVIFDTKHIHFCVRKSLESQGVIHARSLEDLYNILTSERVMNMSLLQPTIIEQTEIEQGEGRLHHAGFDAFICGSVFLRLCHFLHSKKFSSMDVRAFPFKSYLPTMQTFCNCVNVIRASVTYTKLDGEDPPSLRPPVLYVKSNLKWGLNAAMLAELLSSHGTVDIQILNSREALVATTNYVTAREIIYAFKQHAGYEVTNYRFWHHSRLGQGIWWGTIVMAMGSCALMITNLLRSRS